MTRTLLPAVLALALSAPLASAQDWSGSYFGAVLGYGAGDSNHINGNADRDAPAISGGGFGLALGHNFALSNGTMVLGVELDAAALGIEGMTGPGSASGFGCFIEGCRTEVHWLATLRGRAGVVQGRTLWYGTAGLAVGGVEATIPGDATLNEGTRTATGWTLGLGAEHQLNDRLSLKGEVLHTDLGQTRYDDQSFEPGFYVDVVFTQLRLGLNYRF